MPVSGALSSPPARRKRRCRYGFARTCCLSRAETLTVRVVGTENAMAGNAGMVTISDNEPYTVTLTLPVVDEDAGTATINIGLDSRPLAGEQVVLSSPPPTAPRPTVRTTTPVATTVTLTADTLAAAVPVPILNDTNREDP
jgi:hypothetical protein